MFGSLKVVRMNPRYEPLAQLVMDKLSGKPAISLVQLFGVDFGNPPHHGRCSSKGNQGHVNRSPGAINFDPYRQAFLFSPGQLSFQTPSVEAVSLQGIRHILAQLSSSFSGNLQLASWTQQNHRRFCPRIPDSFFQPMVFTRTTQKSKQPIQKAT